MLATGVGLRFRKGWARRTALIASVPLIFGFPIGTISAIYAIGYLRSKERYEASIAGVGGIPGGGQLSGPPEAELHPQSIRRARECAKAMLLRCAVVLCFSISWGIRSICYCLVFSIAYALLFLPSHVLFREGVSEYAEWSIALIYGNHVYKIVMWCGLSVAQGIRARSRANIVS